MVAPAALVFPAGTVLDFAGSSTPDGWLECDGSAVSRTTYAALFSAIGTTYGAGNGSTTFNLPAIPADRGLPDKVSENGSSTNTITAGSWSNLPGGDVAFTIVFPEPTLVRVNYGAWVSKATAAADIRMGCLVTGGGDSEPSEPNWGATVWAGAGAAQYGMQQASKVVECDGSTTFRLRAYAAAGSGNLNYPFLEVTPLRLVGGSYKIIATGPVGDSTPAEPAPGEVLVEAAVWEPGESMWDFLQRLVDAVGKRLWCDENRQWHLTDPLSGTEGGLVLSGGVSVTYASDLIDREREWFDAVVITYRWRDADDVEHVRYDTASLPGWSKVYAVEYERPYPGAGAAAAILARGKGRGRRISIEAMSDYSATPGQAASITLPNTPLQTGMVSAVTWRLPDNEMRVATRDLIDTPPGAWLYTPAEIAWEDVTAGTDWTEYEYEE